jgi:hypothetical protein
MAIRCSYDKLPYHRDEAEENFLWLREWMLERVSRMANPQLTEMIVDAATFILAREILNLQHETPTCH